MAHNRKLVFGTVDLVKYRDLLNAPSRKALSTALNQVRDDVERIMVSSLFLEGAPFKWVGLIFRIGLENDSVPEYQKINKRYGDLPLAMEIDIQDLTNRKPEEFENYFKEKALTALLHVGKKYALPFEVLEGIRNQLSVFGS